MDKIHPRNVVKLGHDRRNSGDRRRATFDYPSAFVAQVLNNRGAEPLGLKPARNAAVEAYAKGGSMAERRAPAGWGHTQSV